MGSDRAVTKSGTQLNDEHTHIYIYACIYLSPWAFPHLTHPLGLHRTPGRSPCYTAAAHQLPISHTIVFICQCYCLSSSYLLLPPKRQPVVEMEELFTKSLSLFTPGEQLDWHSQPPLKSMQPFHWVLDSNMSAEVTCGTWTILLVSRVIYVRDDDSLNHSEDYVDNESIWTILWSKALCFSFSLHQ